MGLRSLGSRLRWWRHDVGQDRKEDDREDHLLGLSEQRSRSIEARLEIVDHCRRAGKPIHTADAWIASTALQWRIPLVTADFRDYQVIDDLEVVPIR